MPVQRDEAVKAAGALKRAIESADADQLNEIYAPDAVIWHNTDLVEQSRSDLVDGVVGLGAACAIAMDVQQLDVTDTGFVQTQEWTFRVPSGAALNVHSAFVVTLDGDHRVARLDEYVDSAGLAALGELLAGASAEAGTAGVR
jgi:uncharacterized protein